MANLFVVTLLILGLNSCFASEENEFLKFKLAHDKHYSSLEEEALRLAIFKDNLKKIEEHNARSDVSWWMEVNQFADLTEEEFQTTMLGGYVRTPKSQHQTKDYSHVKINDLPDSVDWRDKGNYISEPKNQGGCGSCWAFATTENIESYVAINNGSLLELSTQEVTTCTPNPLHCGGTGGCRGSIPQLGYNYVQLMGITTDDEYPYWSGTTGLAGFCKYDLERRTPVVGITGYNTLPPNSIEATMSHIANEGPLAVAGDATAWQFYGSGVFTGCSYSKNIALNHAIQMVGYGTDETHGDFWIVRNSWGARWGENGYIRLQRETELTCGIDMTPMDGTACVGGPGNTQQKVCGMCGILFDMSFPLGASLHDF